MPDRRAKLQAIIHTLRRLRVRQGDFDHVVDVLLAEASAVFERSPTGPLANIAMHVKARAQEILRHKKSVPKFVVEDLIEEFVERLEEEVRRA